MSGRAPALGLQSEFAGTKAKKPFRVGPFRWIAAVVETIRERRELQTLDERMLKDIGLTTGDVYREASKSMFDLPSNKLR